MVIQKAGLLDKQIKCTSLAAAHLHISSMRALTVRDNLQPTTTEQIK
jgi:hypothetical protein